VKERIRNPSGAADRPGGLSGNEFGQLLEEGLAAEQRSASLQTEAINETQP
jgi:hypothetical protein